MASVLANNLNPGICFVQTEEIVESDPGYYHAKSSDQYVSVIARIKDIVAWHSLSGTIQLGSEVFHKRKQCWVVTATMPIELFKEIQGRSFVLSLQIPSDVMPL
ncbi:MAG: hypothetical protein ACHQUC_02700 [Chlamydiales bacterium]